MLAISVNDLGLEFGDKVILQNISFSLEDNDKLGIIGVNGSGKTTLFKLITGEYSATSGEVYISKGKSVGILTQYGAFDENGSDGCESALEHMHKAFPGLLADEERLHELETLLGDTESELHDAYVKEYTSLNERFIRDGGLEFRGRCSSILTKLGFDEEHKTTAVNLLSGGQRTRLALAVELSREPDILMLDEPTNHLDIETLAWLEGFLIQYKKCVMVISHDRYFLDRVTNKTLNIENKRAKLYNGNYTKSIEMREYDREIYEKHYKEQQKEIARQEAYIAQQRQWNRERNIIAAESRLKMLEKMEKLEAPLSAPRGIKMKFTSSIASGNEVLTVKDLSMGFGNRVLFEHLNFLVCKNDRLLIVGKNGCGKSTLIKLIMGKLRATCGRIDTGYNVEIGYYDQENQNLDPSLTVLEELWGHYPNLTEQKIRATLAAFNFRGDDIYKKVSMLSGGERARLTLSKLILSKMNFLVLDEPTNHLDVDSREALENALEGFDGTILCVSHDRYFIEKLATRIIELKPNGYVDSDMFDYSVTNEGHAYSEFQNFVLARKENCEMIGRSAPVTESTSKEQYLKNKQNAADARRRENHLKKIRVEMEKLEAELEEVEQEMMGDAACDYKRVAELDMRKNEIEERLFEIYGELEEQ